MHLALRAHPHILGVWRAVLVLAVLPLAFCSSLFLRPGSALWWIATCVWGTGFVFFYLFYLPVKQRRLSLELSEDKLVLRAGVFSDIQRTAPIARIQYIQVRSSLIHKWFGLSTLVVVCAGGRITVPGLGESQVQTLITSIFH